jgi:hypothetical protein
MPGVIWSFYMKKRLSLCSLCLCGECILVFLDYRISDHQPLIRLFHPEDPQGAELYTLGISEA